MTHPDTETIAALIDGRLTDAERADVQRHLAECDDCFELVRESIAVRASLETAVAPAPRVQKRSWPLRGWALAAAITLVAFVGYRVVAPTLESPEAQAAKLSRQQRGLPTLLHGAFANAAPDGSIDSVGTRASATRGANGMRVVAEYPRLAAVEGELRELVETRRPRDLKAWRALGVSLLHRGAHDDAIRNLQRAAELAPDDVGVMNDLAAAHLNRFRRSESWEDLLDAFELLGRATRSEPTDDPALAYNLALAYDELLDRPSAGPGLDSQTRRLAWQQAIERQPDETWRNAALQRRGKIGNGSIPGEAPSVDTFSAARRDGHLVALARRSPAGFADYLLEEALASPDRVAHALADTTLQDAAVAIEETTGDTFASDLLADLRRAGAGSALARAHAHVAAARAASVANDEDGAVEAYDAARALLSDRDALHFLAETRRTLVQTAGTEVDGRPAQAMLRRLELEERRYGWVGAELRWTVALWLGGAGQFEAMVGLLEQAARDLRRVGRRANADRARALAAEALIYAGQRSAAWDVVADALVLDDATALPSPWGPWEIATRMARMSERPWAAALFLRNRERAGFDKPEERVEHAIERARIALETGRQDAVAAALKELEQAIGSVDQKALSNDYRTALLRLSLRAGNSRGAAALNVVEQLIAHFAEEDTAAQLPDVYLLRGDIHRDLGQLDEAATDYDRGLEALHTARKTSGGPGQRAMLLDRGSELIDRRMSLELERGRPERALAEWLTFRSAEIRLAESSAADIALPDRTAALVLVMLEGRVHAWWIRDGAIAHHALDLTRETVRRAITPLVDRGASRGAVDTALADLSRDLLTPFQRELQDLETLFVLPDALLGGVPVAALPLADGRALIEQTSVVSLAQLTAEGSDQSRRRAATEPRRWTVVGNPSFDRREFSWLDDLPGSELEAGDITRLYGEVTRLSGAGATRDAVMEALRTSDAFHFAGHARPGRDPSSAALILAPGHDGADLLTAEDLLVVGPELELVVLGGCRTAGGRPSRRRRRARTDMGVAHRRSRRGHLDALGSRRRGRA